MFITDSVLPNLSYLTNDTHRKQTWQQIPIENNDILSLIRKLNAKKANGSDGISGHFMRWYSINGYIPIFLTIDQYLSFLFVVKFLKKISLPIFTIIFRPGDNTTNQLIDFVNEIHHAFDSIKSLEVRAAFLGISKAFDKVWHD